MKKKKKLLLSLNKKKVSALNRSLQDQVLGGTVATYGCGGGWSDSCGCPVVTEHNCGSGHWGCTQAGYC